MNNRDFGTVGEQEAMHYLAKRGYTILCRNFRVGRMGELDLIGRDGDILCFIEVKTRSNDHFGTPAQAVTSLKQATIKRLAQVYIQRFGLYDLPVRFDIVALMMDRKGKIQDIQLLQNAF